MALLFLFCEVTSPTHPIGTRMLNARHCQISLGQKSVSLDRDLIILVEQADPFATRASLVKHP